jgi:DNA polymerase epsilon subunit 2
MIMGMIVQHEPGKYYLEDLNAKVHVDFSKASTNACGLLTEGSIVITNGLFDSADRIFQASAVVLCESETREKSITALSQGRKEQLDFFGSNNKHAYRADKMKQREEFCKDSSFIVTLSDVWLDRPRVMDKLRTLFQYITSGRHNHDGTLDTLPAMIILIGNFISRPFQQFSSGDSSDRVQYKKNFDALADMLVNEFPELVDADEQDKMAPLFVFVPGPNDPTAGPTQVLPRPSILPLFFKSFQEKVSNSVFTSNPAHIRFYSSEIVIFRDDLQQKLRRHSILTQNLESSTHSLNEHVVQTVFTNSHLSPLPTHIRPTVWCYDHALRLYPIPHGLILADKCNTFEISHHESKAFNPSSFPVDFSFVIYRPLANKTEFHQVPVLDTEA